MKYNPALDGLRALAVLAVVAFHAGVLSGGYIGVDVFFVLSGYLITQVLTENPDLRRFYWRRVNRLVPPLALMLAAYVAVFSWIDPAYAYRSRDALLAFLYLTDYGHNLVADPLRHTWSLSVEEHFYLLWPLIFLRWRPSILALSAAYVVATLWRMHYSDPWWHAYPHFDARLSGLILGCLIAQAPRNRFPAWPGLAVLAALAAFLPWDLAAAHGIGGLPVEIAAAVAIMGSPPRWLAHLSYVGKLSYGIYLWHYPIASYAISRKFDPAATLALSLLGSVALAALSYHTIEAAARQRMRRAGTPA
jgi:peptidoglycan/LPS O-acetylase OafA/YrhL